jgi:aerobic-type carbon monoxide dehydrogenase small subunit (CoxS/CutS family)
MDSVRRTLRYGETEVTVDSDGARPLLDVLRAEIGVRSASRACTDRSCGACRIILDGVMIASCDVRWGDVREGAVVETYEQLGSEPAAVRAVDAFALERPTRCRMCVGALGVTAVMVSRSTASREDAIEQGVKGATCLCTGRGSWRRALSK